MNSCGTFTLKSYRIFCLMQPSNVHVGICPSLTDALAIAHRESEQHDLPVVVEDVNNKRIVVIFIGNVKYWPR